MSKIGRKPIVIPKGVQVTIEKDVVKVKGPKGELSQEIKGTIKLKINESDLIVERGNEESQEKAYHGLYRSLLANMITGTSTGFSKMLVLSGTGYRAALQGKKLSMTVGFSHPVEFEIPKDLECKVDDQTKITISGIDKQKVGQFAANIRIVKPAEPYQGKGIRYSDEKVRRKAGKTGKK
ncbi:MAG TPA: 50S ribosomal protein L6 [Spirochaetia bacterium]|nr:MAG: 50S ribosomal protein L6 [Spirochaetes bacterium GWB1_36_13]HCL57325.1 50S ribosomal protein L6 [Spirochaetia bacterium]